MVKWLIGGFGPMAVTLAENDIKTDGIAAQSQAEDLLPWLFGGGSGKGSRAGV